LHCSSLAHFCQLPLLQHPAKSLVDSCARASLDWYMFCIQLRSFTSTSTHSPPPPLIHLHLRSFTSTSAHSSPPPLIHFHLRSCASTSTHAPPPPLMHLHLHSCTTHLRCVRCLAVIHCNGFEIGSAEDGIGSFLPSSPNNHWQSYTPQATPVVYTPPQRSSTTAACRTVSFISKQVLQPHRIYASVHLCRFAAVTTALSREGPQRCSFASDDSSATGTSNSTNPSICASSSSAQHSHSTALVFPPLSCGEVVCNVASRFALRPPPSFSITRPSCTSRKQIHLAAAVLARAFQHR
jgi:hypothetical protein